MIRLPTLLFFVSLVAGPAGAQQVAPPPAPPPVPLREQANAGIVTDGAYDSTAVDVKAKLIAAGPRSYPAQYERAGIGGTVTLQFVIDSLGRVDPNSVRTVQATNLDFQAAAVQMLISTRYQPAVKDGRPVPMKASQVVTFKP